MAVNFFNINWPCCLEGPTPPPPLKAKISFKKLSSCTVVKEHAVQLNPPLPFPGDKLGAISNSKVFLVFLPSKGT